MINLTEKQRKYREYYAQNAERIKADKRASYNKSTKKPRKPSKPKVTLEVKVTKPAIKLVSEPVDDAPYKPRKLSARERIENLKIAKELDCYE